MKKQQSGFTLIELIMVIVVLGILAAFAIPKFANLGGDARLAVMQGALASVKSAAAIVHSSALAKNDPALAEVELSDGTEVELVNLYPAATAAGIFAAAGLAEPDFKAVDGTDVVTIQSGAKATCSFTYTLADADKAPKIDATNLTEANCN